MDCVFDACNPFLSNPNLSNPNLSMTNLSNFKTSNKLKYRITYIIELQKERKPKLSNSKTSYTVKPVCNNHQGIQASRCRQVLVVQRWRLAQVWLYIQEALN